MPAINRAARPAARVATRAPARSVAKPVRRQTRATKVHESVTAGLKPIRNKLTMGDLYESITSDLAETRNPVDKRQVKEVIESLTNHMVRSVMPRGAGVFSLSGFLVVKTKDIPAKRIKAQPAGEYPNPFAGGEMQYREARPAKIKPATTKVKVIAARKLKAAALGE